MAVSGWTWLPIHETKKAIQECLPALLDVEVEALRGGKLEAIDFRAIVTKDPVRTLLRWMDDPDTIKLALETSGSEWTSFRAVCRDAYGFDPEKDGTITAAEKLTSGKAAWALVWERYKEAPRAYPKRERPTFVPIADQPLVQVETKKREAEAQL